MSNFERPSQQGWAPLQSNREQHQEQGWAPLQLNREQQHQESNQGERDDESEEPIAIMPDLNIAPAPKTRGGVLGKISHWGYCPKHGTFSGDNCDELPPHE